MALIRGTMSNLLAATSLLASCGQQPALTQLKVVGGVEEAAGTYPASLRLDITAEGIDKKIYCTGTVVRSDLVLTAAHCFQALGSAPVKVRLYDSEHGPVTAKQLVSDRVLLFPAPTPHGSALLLLASDVAFVVFKPGALDQIKPAVLAAAAPKPGDVVHLVGYGATDSVGANISSNPTFKRHTGANKLKGVYPGLADALLVDTVAADPAHANDGVGDSGGALYNDQGEIVGITTGGGVIVNGLLQEDNKTPVSAEHPYRGFYTNVNNLGVRNFIDAVLKEPVPTAAPVVTPTPLTDPTGEHFHG